MARTLVQRGAIVGVVAYPLVRPSDALSLSQPTAATVAVRTPATTTAAAACTRDTTSVTTITAALEGDTTLTLASAITQVRGYRYLVRSTTGEQFIVRCAASQTSATLRLASPIPMDLAVASTVFGIALSRALTALETATEGKGALDWTATIDSVAYAWSEEIEIVRRMPRWELDEDELIRRMPDVLALRERNDLALDELLGAALEDELLPRLRARKDSSGEAMREANIVSTWALVPAHVAACALFLARAQTRTREDRDEARSELEAKIDLALADADAWYDAPQGDSVDVDQERANFSPMFYSR